MQSLLSFLNAPGIWRRVWTHGSMASLLSAVVLVWRGRAETGSAAAAINAPSHWLWGRRALRSDGASLRDTLPGLAIHHASSLFWALFYEALQARRRRAASRSVVADAAAITAVAAWVDLKLVPERLTPGFERRLSARSLSCVYLGFAAGLALGALLVRAQASSPAQAGVRDRSA
jgi:hypothetical protein